MVKLTLEESEVLSKLLSGPPYASRSNVAFYTWEKALLLDVRKKVNRGLNLAAEQGWIKDRENA